MIIRPLLICALTAGALYSSSPTIRAEDRVAPFYKGRQIKLVIGYEAGGVYDLYARLVTSHMGKHIPGDPTFLPQYMAGAGSRVAANWLYNVAPRDGTVIGTVGQGTPLDQARKESGVQFDVARFNWIGNPLVDNATTFSTKSSGLTTIEDAVAKGGLICGGTGPSDPLTVNAQILNNLLGTKIRIVRGYTGVPDVRLAMQRGELNCAAGIALATAKVLFSSEMSEHQLAMLVQWGTEKNPAISAYEGHDVPLITEFARNDADREVLVLITSGITVGRPLVAPPGVPQERVDALRKAFEDTIQDPEFLADAKKQKLAINPISGEKLQKLAVAKILRFERGVFVQPSFHVGDIPVVLDVLKKSDGRLKAMIVAESEADLDKAVVQNLHEAGVRGVRIEMRDDGAPLDEQNFGRIVSRAAKMSWVVALHLWPNAIVRHAEMIRRAPAQTIIENYVQIDARDGLDQPALRTLLDLANEPHIWLKTASAYRMLRKGATYEQVTQIARAVHAKSPDRMIWGTDWPHGGIFEPGMVPNDGDLVDMLLDFVPNEANRRKLLVDNPKRLFDFD